MYGSLCGATILPTITVSLQSVSLLQLTYAPKHYRVSYKARFNLKSSKKLELFGMIAFNKQLQVCGFEAAVENAGLTFDGPVSSRASIIANICRGTQIFCPVGTSYQQYASQSECVSFFSGKQTTFGTYDRADQNTVICRLIHVRFAMISPATHCPHLGKKSTGACTNKPAQSYFTGTTDFLQCAYQFRS